MYPVAIPFDNVDEEQIKAAALESGGFGALYGIFRSDQLDFRHFDLLSDVVGISCEYARNANFVPVRLVCGGITVANADCAYDPYPSSAVYSKSRRPPLMAMTLLVMVVGVSLPFSPLASYLQPQALPLSYFRG